MLFALFFSKMHFLRMGSSFQELLVPFSLYLLQRDLICFINTQNSLHKNLVSFGCGQVPVGQPETPALEAMDLMSFQVHLMAGVSNTEFENYIEPHQSQTRLTYEKN